MSDSNHSIVVPIDTGKDEVQEWAMLELNGELLPPKESNPVQLGSPGKENPEQDCLLLPGTVELGSLRFDNGEPTLICGTHELKGKVEELKQPFCVLQKTVKEEEVSYSVRGVVKRKVLFNRYPKTIMR